MDVYGILVDVFHKASKIWIILLCHKEHNWKENSLCVSGGVFSLSLPRTHSLCVPLSSQTCMDLYALQLLHLSSQRSGPTNTIGRAGSEFVPRSRTALVRASAPVCRAASGFNQYSAYWLLNIISLAFPSALRPRAPALFAATQKIKDTERVLPGEPNNTNTLNDGMTCLRDKRSSLLKDTLLCQKSSRYQHRSPPVTNNVIFACKKITRQSGEWS